MYDYRSWDGPDEPCRQRGLAAVAAPVYSHDDRTASYGLTPYTMGERFENCT
jgi:hypothetical protein